MKGRATPESEDFSLLVMFLLVTFSRMRLFCLQLEASCLQWSFSIYS